MENNIYDLIYKYQKSVYFNDTFSTYENITKFCGYIAKHYSPIIKIIREENITTSMIHDFLEKQLVHNESLITIIKMRDDVMSFLTFLRSEDWTIEVDPIITFENKLHLPEILSKNEILSIANSDIDPSAAALIYLLYFARPSRKQIINLKKSDIDFSNGLVYFDVKPSHVPHECLAAIKTHLINWKSIVSDINKNRLNRHKEKGQTFIELIDSEYVFQSDRNDQVSTAHISRMLEKSSFKYFDEIFSDEMYSRSIDLEVSQWIKLFTTDKIKNSGSYYESLSIYR